MIKTYVALGDTDNSKLRKLAKLFAARMSGKGYKLITGYRELETELMIGSKGSGFRFADCEQDFPGIIHRFAEFDRMKLRSFDPSWIMKPMREQKTAVMACQMLLGLNFGEAKAKFLVVFSGDTVTKTTASIAKKAGIKVVDANTPAGMAFILKIIRT